jgi:hypothetical protein
MGVLLFADPDQFFRLVGDDRSTREHDMHDCTRMCVLRGCDMIEQAGGAYGIELGHTATTVS